MGIERLGVIALVVAFAAAPAAGQSSDPPLEPPVTDTEAPDTQLLSSPPALSSATSATLVFGSEPGATFECRLGTASFAECPPDEDLDPAKYAVTYPGLVDGAYTFQVRATDLAGNVEEEPATASWTVDTDPPETTVVVPPAPLTGSDAVRVTVGSDEVDVDYVCSLDGGAAEPCPGAADAAGTYTVAYSGLAHGSHNLTVVAVDGAQNRDVSPATASWVVDREAPDTDVVSGPPVTTEATSGAFVLSSEPDATFECSLDAPDAWGACPADHSISGLTLGPHSLRVRAVDRAGNVDASPDEWTWTVTAAAVGDPIVEDESPFEPPPLTPQPQPSDPPRDEPQPQPQQRGRGKPKPTFVSNERTRTYWSYVYRDSAVYRRPSKKSRRVGRLSRFTYYGFDDVVIVRKRVGRWTQVRYSGLGRRTGWVWTGALGRPRLNRMSVVIDRRRFRLTVFRNGKRVFGTRVGVGAKGSPTPGGLVFLRERLVPRDKGGLYGPLAFGTSTYSKYRTDWPGGGQVGIHGTDQPGLIPGRISNGCIRLRNSRVLKLGRLVRIGTPVRIR